MPSAHRGLPGRRISPSRDLRSTADPPPHSLAPLRRLDARSVGDGSRSWTRKTLGRTAAGVPDRVPANQTVSQGGTPRNRPRLAAPVFPPCAPSPADRRRQQILSHPRPVPLKPWLELGNRQSIDSRRSLILHHASIGAEHVAGVPRRLPSAAMPPVSVAWQPPRQTQHQNRPKTGSACLLPSWPTRVCFCFVVSHRGLLSYSRASRLALHSACAKPLRPLLTSGGSSQRLTTPVAQRQVARSPRVLRTHFHAYPCRIYITAFRASTGLCENWPAHPTVKPLSASCSSGQRFAYSFLQIPPRDGHPCRSANTSPCRVCRGLTPPSECALPGAPKKRGTPVRECPRFATKLEAITQADLQNPRIGGGLLGHFPELG